MAGPYRGEVGYTVSIDLDDATIVIKKHGETMTIEEYIKRLVVEALDEANQCSVPGVQRGTGEFDQ